MNTLRQGPSIWDTLYTEVAVGSPVPPYTPHAVSVSLPKWRDVVGYEEGEKRVVDSMLCGYPRFFIHAPITELASICEKRYALDNERSMLFPTQKIANCCRTFIQERLTQCGAGGSARLVQLLICPDDLNKGGKKVNSIPTDVSVTLHIVLFPKDAVSIAKEFWQHTGLGISSRLADKCLSLLSDGLSLLKPNGYYGMKGYNKHYSKSPMSSRAPSTRPTILPSSSKEELNAEHTNYMEERYGRNLPVSAAEAAKSVLRARIAQGLAANQTQPQTPCVSADDVYLYPCGMAAIWHAHRLLLDVRPPAKSVCFGFPYTDTLKVLQKWGPGCHFLGHGLDSDFDSLESIIAEELEHNPGKSPFLMLVTELPSNPLLRSADLPRLRALADKYDFPIIVDETIGNYVNVDVLPYADIVASSLTKVFSGASNVMGGSLVLNPAGRHYQVLKDHLNKTFEDIYFDEDAIFMERNSRDFKRRIRIIDANAEAACDFLRTRSIAGGFPTAAIKEVFYPKYTTRERFDTCRKTAVDPEDGKVGGFGGLFSLTFSSMAASKAFFDTLQCSKGPSLGTNFTLACPYSILAHFTELDWAHQYGVEANLVRISVGVEDRETLISWMMAALDAAEAVASA